MDRPPAPTVAQLTHHSVELSWDESLDRLNRRPAKNGGTKMAGDTRIKVQLERRDKSGSWSNVYSGYAKQCLLDDLEPWETYRFRLRFTDTKRTSEWSPELSVTTNKRPKTGEDIHTAINHQNVGELERVLQTKEAPIEATDKYGFTPLMQAAQKGYTDMIEMLIDHGAEVNAQNDAGKTALMLASFAGKLDAVKELCYHGADKQLSDKGGSTAFHWTMDGGHTELADWYIENGVDLSVTDVNGWTPLLRIAAVAGHKQMASLVLRAGADVNVADKDGKTALMLAVINGHYGLAEVLLDHDANITAKSEYGKTAYDMAISMDKTRFVKLFESHMDKKGIKYHH